MDEDILEYCISKWEANSDDERIKYFVNHYHTFIANKSTEMKGCIDRLLREFEYYPHEFVNEEWFVLHNELLRKYKLDIEVSVFAVLQSQRGTYNSSYEYLGEYKVINSLGKYNVIPDLSNCFEKEYWDNIENIVFVDDFCGSGKTFIDYLESIKEYIVNKKIYYLVIHTMKSAEKRICDYARNNGIDVIILTCNSSEAAFSINNELCADKDLFEKESLDFGIKSSEVFGYANTESLVAFHENTPNNTLGIFIKDTENNVALFPRKVDKKPAFMTMNSKRRKKKNNNYVRKARLYKR